MPRLLPEKPLEVIRKLRRLGFEGPFGGGKHVFMRHPETGGQVGNAVKSVPGTGQYHQPGQAFLPRARHYEEGLPVKTSGKVSRR